MMIPWYRSRAFWFGVVGLVMLLGLWGLYPRTVMDASFSNGSGLWSFEKGSGTLRFSYAEPYRGQGTGIQPGFHTGVRKIDSDQPVRVFPPAFRCRRSTGCNVSLGIWLIALIYTVIWSGAMVWWLRRKHRLMNAPLGKG